MKIKMIFAALFFLSACTSTPTTPPTEPPVEPPVVSGWTNLVEKYLVQSDGTFSLGTSTAKENTTRDKGSKINYFDSTVADNLTGEAYWFHQGKIVDSKGSATNEAGLAYGTDPLNPNKEAIKPFQWLSNNSKIRSSTLKEFSAQYPDWFLFRKGQTHSKFGESFAGGRSEAQPMVIASYGLESEPRAILDPDAAIANNKNPLSFFNSGPSVAWMHMVVASIVLPKGARLTYFPDAVSLFDGGPTTAYYEDVLFLDTVTYGPMKSTFYRCSFAYISKTGEGHKQSYYTSGARSQSIFKDTMLYKGGYKSNARTDIDPKRDIFSRNIYHGGGAQMGGQYINMISMDGGSGGPQMRYGGTMEDSLIVEGYLYSSTKSNPPTKNQWLEANGQVGTSTIVKNNVHFILKYPNGADPDTDKASDKRSQPGWGYLLQGASFGSTVSGNIFSGAMLEDDLKSAAEYGFGVAIEHEAYSNGVTYTQQNNVVENNIAYRVKEGMRTSGNAIDTKNITMKNNIIVASVTGIKPAAKNVTVKDQIHITGNEVFAPKNLEGHLLGDGNTLKPYAEGLGPGKRFKDPDRTVKRYLLEVMKVELLDWQDDPHLDKTQVAGAVSRGEVFDPAGLRTFGMLYTSMRKGGTVKIGEGKPRFGADYAWDKRLEAKEVNKWIRQGFESVQE